MLLRTCLDLSMNFFDSFFPNIAFIFCLSLKASIDLFCESLNLRTHAIKVDSAAESLQLRPGLNTQDAVANACSVMMLGLINNAIDELTVHCDSADVRIVVTGGHGPRLLLLFPHAVLVPDLVMEGLTYVG